MSKSLGGLVKGAALGLAILAIPASAFADTNKEWCEAHGGTWKGPNETDGICACEMAANPNLHAAKVCEFVGGQTVTHGGISQCALSSQQIGRARSSSAFRGVLASSGRAIQHREDMP